MLFKKFNYLSTAIVDELFMNNIKNGIENYSALGASAERPVSHIGNNFVLFLVKSIVHFVYHYFYTHYCHISLTLSFYTA